MALWLAVAFAIAFSFTNGIHDVANSIATLVATRGAQPGQAVVLSAAFNVLGALVVGTAVAGTIAGLVTVTGKAAVTVTGSGVLGAAVWNVLTWLRGLPSSSAHALTGALVGAALVDRGTPAVRWGGLQGWKPVGVFGVLIALAISPLLGLIVAFVLLRLERRLLRRATRRVEGPIRAGQWLMSAALSFSHGANDGQKAMGVIAALLLADGRTDTLSVPFWAKLGCGAALALGTSLGGWRIVATVGRRIFQLAPLDAFASQSASTAVILAASYVGAPVSTTQVVASSVIGVGTGRHRRRHVRWAVVRSMALAWLLTLPASAGLGAAGFVVWRAVG